MVVLVLSSLDSTYNSAIIYNSTSTTVRHPSEFNWYSPCSKDSTGTICQVLLVSVVVLVLFAIDTNNTHIIPKPRTMCDVCELPLLTPCRIMWWMIDSGLLHTTVCVYFYLLPKFVTYHIGLLALTGDTVTDVFICHLVFLSCLCELWLWRIKRKQGFVRKQGQRWY